MGATSIARPRREKDGYFEKYFVGTGIDMGCGDDPVTPDCMKYDLMFGYNAQEPGVKFESFDWVFSSHCLEHLPEPYQAVKNWWKLVKPGGHMIISVPDWLLYEQRRWPSASNTDHKWSFSMFRPTHMPHSRHLVLGDLVVGLECCQPISYKLCDTKFNYESRLYDRTWHDKAEAEVEIICRKRDSNYWCL